MILSAMMALSLVALAVATQQWMMAAATAFIWFLIRVSRWRFAYPRWLAYAGLFPFFVWFLALPKPVQQTSFFSIDFLWIFAWYFLALGLLQLWSVEREARRKLIGWNSTLVMGIAVLKPTLFLLILLALWLGTLWAEMLQLSFGHRRFWKANLQRWAVVLLVIAVFVLAHRQMQRLGWTWTRQHWNADFQMVGFEPTTWLGSFSQDYQSSRAHEVALELWADSLPSSYWRGVIYSEYSSTGLWRASLLQKVYRPQANWLEFSLFSLGSFSLPAGDSSTFDVWIYPYLPTFGYYFMPSGSWVLGVIADSLQGDGWGCFKNQQETQGHGYLVFPDQERTLPPEPVDLNVHPRLQPWLARLWTMLTQESRQWKPQNFQGTSSFLLQLKDWFVHEFRYSLQVPQIQSLNPLENFIQHRQGYCEYFATLATLMLRQKGIPARYVAGFAGPEQVAKNRWILRRSHAHAWVEVWDSEQEKWMVFDPTPPDFRPVHRPISGWQQRWESLRAWGIRSLFYLRDGSWKLSMDAVQIRLQQWKNLILGGGLLLFLGVSFVWLLIKQIRKRKRPSRDVYHQRALEWQKQLQLAETQLRRLGVERLPHETVQHLLERLPAQTPQQVLKRLQDYQKNRFRKYG